MDTKTIEILELPKVLERLSAHASFGPSHALAVQLRPSSDGDEVLRRLRTTTEARALLESHSSVSIGGARDIAVSTGRARLGGLLQPTDLLDIGFTLVAAGTLRGTILRTPAKFPLLAETALGLKEIPGLEAEIRRCINERAEVVDAASPQLAAVRSDLRSTRDRLLHRMQEMMASTEVKSALQEPIVTVRDGRYVVPVKAEHYSSVRGVVHGQSASGATLFVEPLACVDMSNKLIELQEKERREVERVLRNLSTTVAAYADELDSTLAAVADIDLALAKAKYASATAACEPLVVTGPGTEMAELKLVDARHPLLQGRVVPITIRVGNEVRALVITGPNTGGKTVALKTAGLLTLMAQCGLHVPAAEGSTVRVFDSVFADIGDEQSIEQSLSTFSSHMKRIVEILGHADVTSLVLLDELGAGTDPVEGSALARSIIDELLMRGCWTIATTHYPELKSYAHLTLGVENASVEFDLETLAPTYRLIIGQAGSSNALAIASRLGLDPKVIENASAMVDPVSKTVDGLLSSIKSDRDEAASELAKARAIREDAEKYRGRQREREREAGAAMARRIEAMSRDIEAKADQASRLMREALLKAERPGVSVVELREQAALVREAVAAVEASVESVRTTLPSPKPEYEPEPVVEGGIQVGCAVRVGGLGQVGEVVGISLDRGQAEVQLGALKMRVPIADCERVSKSALRESPGRASGASVGVPALAVDREKPRLDFEIRGWRVDEMAPELDKYIDAAYLAGMPYIRIIHGKGTGVLRQAVRERLAAHSLVRSYESAEPNQGGEGVTIAHLAT